MQAGALTGVKRALPGGKSTGRIIDIRLAGAVVRRLGDIFIPVCPAGLRQAPGFSFHHPGFRSPGFGTFGIFQNTIHLVERAAFHPLHPRYPLPVLNLHHQCQRERRPPAGQLVKNAVIHRPGTATVPAAACPAQNLAFAQHHSRRATQCNGTAPRHVEGGIHKAGTGIPQIILCGHIQAGAAYRTCFRHGHAENDLLTGTAETKGGEGVGSDL
ncbi:Uncharacterised protein [Salmonella enterica subsp. enterica serovar Pullorum]|nr:Uncharacterised protein [Salmonella enterica subsp. enterica serovar Pullorum]